MDTYKTEVMVTRSIVLTRPKKAQRGQKNDKNQTENKKILTVFSVKIVSV